ncbi:MAG TPA: M20/M25/M40 family metallo-hydrolase [Pyrinomonadaceae bacterium]|nr:M20/M25/M40 family metallo-hydrolase [Pyrinomonadaceae bacterium]
MKTFNRLDAAFLALALLVASVSPPRVVAQTRPPAQHQQFLREVFKELIEIDTTDTERGDNTRAARAMAERLRAAGFADEDVRVLVPEGNARKGNLVARLRGTNPALKPLLLLAHIDVVEARREDWSPEFDPFKLTERDGYLYGRGTTDDKAMAAIFVANLIRLKQEGYKPARDIVVALTADEEGGQFNGVEFLLKNHRALIDAEYGINEGAGGQIKKGRKLLNGVQASEKVYQSFRLETANRGGHSSVPRRDNAVYQLAAALGRLAAFDFPVNLNEVTRTYFGRMARLEQGQLAADMKAVAQTTPDPAAVKRLSETPYYNALLRTTCVPTLLQGGHAENALPQLARATVNCRILPQETAEQVRQTLVRVVADEQIKVTPVDESKPSPPSPLRADVMGPIESITEQLWPGVPVVPVMGTGATDSLFFRQAGIPMYGVSGIFGDIEDGRAHGKDERILITSLHDGQEFLYRLAKALSSGG